MTALISAELLRLRTVRSPRYVALGLLAAVAIVVVMNVDSAAAASSPTELADSLRWMGLLGVLAAGALAATNVGADFQRGAAAMSYLSDPHRGRVAAAGGVTYAGLGFVFAGVAAGVALAVGLLSAQAAGVSAGISATGVARMLGGAAFGGAILGAVGALLGTASRSSTIASTAVFAWNLVENVIVPAGIRPYLPLGLIISLMGGPGDLPWLAAIPLLLGYLAALALVVRRYALPRDLT